MPRPPSSRSWVPPPCCPRLPEKEAWIERAEHETVKELRSHISQRLDELRGTRTTWPLTVNLADDRWIDPARVRSLV